MVRDCMQIPTDKTKEITCLDDLPELAKKLLWQQRIFRNYQLIALTPFAVVLFIVLKLFSKSTNHLWNGLVFLTFFWVMIVAFYAFYALFWGVRCPSCASGYGVGGKCRSCGLPRHHQAESMFNAIRLFDEE